MQCNMSFMATTKTSVNSCILNIFQLLFTRCRQKGVVLWHIQFWVLKSALQWFYLVLTWSDKSAGFPTPFQGHPSIIFWKFIFNCLIEATKKTKLWFFVWLKNLLFLAYMVSIFDNLAYSIFGCILSKLSTKYVKLT